MKRLNKKGISLIVLVITIIVMIILATAIILSLNSSNIVEKAKEAKTASDLANAKNVVVVAKGEWELGNKGGYTEFKDYANAKLQEAGYSLTGENAHGVTEEGEVVTGISAQMVNNNVPIGATITGYTLRTADEYKTYTTSGNENTYDQTEYTETDPQPAEITRDESVTWQYMGLDEKGNALLVGSVTASTPKMTLGGIGGYVNGPNELDIACASMYSTEMGTARSMNIEDVTRVLEYTGEKGSYWDYDTGDYVPMREAKTIDEIEKMTGYSFIRRETPETGKELGTYKANYYYIDKTNDASEFTTDETRINMIYPVSGSTNLTKTYWLASPCVYANFYAECAYFDVRCVKSTSVSVYDMFDSEGYSNYFTYALRPVVTLASSVQIKQVNGAWVLY